MANQDNALIQVLRSADVFSGETQEILMHFHDGMYPKLPSGESLDYGEIALNIAKDHEVIAIKNYEGEVVYLPFNVAVRLLEVEMGLDELSGYCITSIDSLSAATVSTYNDLQSFKREIGNRLDYAIMMVKREMYMVVGELSASTAESISGMSGDVQSISAFTVSSVSALTEGLDEVSGKTDQLRSEFDECREEFNTFSGETERKINELSGGSADYNERIDEIELVHAGAFAAFKRSTGFDDNVRYNPTFENIQQMNVTEAIDYVGQYAKNVSQENTRTREGLIKDELIHAGAFSKMNRSLGFSVNADYTPSTEELEAMTLTEAVDYIASSVKNIEEYLDTEDTRDFIRPITYEQLLSLYMGRKLRQGQLYRITNYQATVKYGITYATTRLPVRDSGSDTNNGFDIVVRAISDGAIDENATLVMSKGKYYFEDCDLESWNVKYSVLNDAARFAWADPQGFGVIYWMKDAYGNEAWYDFKNIVYKVDSKKVFTFHSSETDTDMSLTGRARGNVIGPAYVDNTFDRSVLTLGRNRFTGTVEFGNVIAQGATRIVFDGDFTDCMVSSAVVNRTLSGPMDHAIVGYTVTQ